MADKEVPSQRPPSTENEILALKQFEYANRTANSGSHGLAIQLLQTCCKLAPTNLRYRQHLRKVEKTRYNNNLRGKLLAPLTTIFARMRMMKARRSENHLKVLEHGEAILAQNPWDTNAQLVMAQA